MRAGPSSALAGAEGSGSAALGGTVGRPGAFGAFGASFLSSAQHTQVGIWAKVKSKFCINP